MAVDNLINYRLVLTQFAIVAIAVVSMAAVLPVARKQSEDGSVGELSHRFICFPQAHRPSLM